jgi:putative CocE/NonD family hydrolase
MPSTSGGDAIFSSEYVTVRDGTRLAIDVHFAAGPAPHPVILAASLAPARVRQEDGSPQLAPYLAALRIEGYTIVNLETRGRGASFGCGNPIRTERAEDYWDLYDVIEWLASQPWCTGRVGMAGCSNQGMTQFRAATTMPPHLAAIAPTSAPLDWATLGWINGPSTYLFSHDGAQVLNGVAVDDDDGTLLAAARTERLALDSKSPEIFSVAVSRRFRDAPVTHPDLHVLPSYWWNHVTNLAVSRTPVLQYAGWRDFFVEQSFALYRTLARLGVPQRLIVGPWYHCDWYDSALGDARGEFSRWYGHWLRDEATGILDEPSVRYYVAGAPEGREWRTVETWPPPGETRRTLALGADLRSDQPGSDVSRSEYVVDYEATTADIAGRWRMGNAEAGGLADRALAPMPGAAVDAASATFTTEPLEDDTEITGFPVARVWLSTTAPDIDLFVYLEEVDAAGVSTILTEGVLRASHRRTRDAPFDNEGLPWHGGFRSDLEPLEPGVPAELAVALFPFSAYVRAGHRLRVAINSFDKDSWDTPVLSPAPTVTIHHDVDRPSTIDLPVIAPS